MALQQFHSLKARCLSVPKDGAFNAARGPSHDYRLENLVFQKWQRVWSDTFEQLGSSSRHFADDFSRFSFIYGLFDADDTVVAFLCSTIFDFQFFAHRAHSYLERYPKWFHEEAIQKRDLTCASLEYCYVDAEWRKSKLPFSLVDVLLCLCAREAFSRGIDRVVAVTRNDRSVNQVVYQRGGEAVVTDAESHNVSVDLISLHRSHFRFGSLPQDSWILELEQRGLEAPLSMAEVEKERQL